MSTATTPKDAAAVAEWFESRPINVATRASLTSLLRQRLAFIEVDKNADANVRMLDYACGSGFMSRVFAPYVSHITAIDVDAGTAELYKSRIGELGEKHKNTHAAVGNLLADTEAPVGNDFDLITVGAALHAFPDAQDAVMCLADRLAPGGVLFVQDRFDDGEYGGRGPRGFTEDGMKTTMSNAGLVNLRFEVLPDKVEIEVMDGEVVGIWCFVARGVKPKGSGLEMEE